ncbi:HK97 gp10 family phage protein [Peptostreptococcus sp. D1]|uniref:HK97 gp10 family phage protein n=1 Tax=Peptostreptococcus sp. D1 TaxID=72304 RepID=UPI0008E9500A|nr:HK97 gp10 family phage protein [Peptostreptococcus sp. D1]SFE87926.1 hypothetical protein SAMN02910278_01945 [Peptostreptococcus sp. D1]
MSSVIVIGADEYIKALDQIERELPQEVEKKLDRKAKELENLISEDIERQGLIRTKHLLKAPKHRKPVKIGKTFEVEVKLNEPHAHLIEEGHELVKYVGAKKKNGGKKVHLGRVKAFRPIQNARDKMNLTYEKDIQNWIYHMIEYRLR